VAYKKGKTYLPSSGILAVAAYQYDQFSENFFEKELGEP
jgi:hypothetical protein